MSNLSISNFIANDVMDIIQKIMFNIWYLGKPPWDTDISPPELIDYIESHPPGRALDLGCGTGTNAITLAKSGWDVIGIDYSPRAIHLGRQKAKQANVNIDLRIGDVTKLNRISGNFDLILDIGCYHSLSDHKQRSYREKINTVLSDKGTLLIYVFFKQHRDSGTGLTEADLNLFSPALKLVKRSDGSERGMRLSSWLWFVKASKAI